MASICTLPPHLSYWGLLGTAADLGPSWSVVSLESVSTDIIIRGFVAQVSAKLVYCNGSKNPLQVRAVFPVDESAAVYHCEARLDSRTIVTHCMEKSKAEKVYKEAVAAGKTAVMAREHADTSDILTLNLGNLPAESRAELKLRMVMELKVQTDGAVSFVLPTVLNPRYAPADHPLLEDQTEGLFERLADERVVYVPQPYSIDVKAQVSGSHKIARVVSHTDPLSVTLSDDAMSAQVGQDGGFKCDHDWSMLVYYNNAYQPHLLRETGDRSSTGIMKDDLLMVNLFPEVPADTYSNKNEIIFVIDRSGSMNGESIQSAKAALLLFLKSLPAGCLFNVVSFGSTFSFLFPEGSRLYTQETLNTACWLQSSMEADMGGTEILLPLQKIYSKPPTPGYSRQILLITDGEVWNVDQVLQLVGRHAHETRLFSVGVGHGASTALVRGAARAGRGRSEMVVQQGLLQQKVMGLVSSMVQESIQNVSIACEVEPVSSVRLVPKVPPVIFGGQHLILYARVPSSAQVKSVTVRGQLGTNTIMNVLEGRHFTVIHDEAKSLHRLAARAQIQQWQLDEEEDVAEDMIALSVASGVVCRRTALVGVDQESGKPVPEYTPPVEPSPLFSRSSVRGGFQNWSGPMRKMRFSSAVPQSGLMAAGAEPQFCLMRLSAAAEDLSRKGSLFGSAAPSQTFGGGGPTFGSAAPSQTFGGAAPTFGSAAPSQTFGGAAPSQTFGGGGPTFGSAAPSQTFGGAAPTFSSAAPSQDFFVEQIFSCAAEDSDDAAEELYCDVEDVYAPASTAQNRAVDLPQHISAGGQVMQKDGSPSGLLEVVSLQQFDGSWKLKDVAQLTNVSLDTLCANNPAKGEEAWATALVLVLLEKKFGDQRDQWTLLATKAQNFIAGCGEQVEELLAKAHLALDSK